MKMTDEDYYKKRSSKIFEEETLLTADPRTSVELAVVRVRRWPLNWRSAKARNEYDVRWRAKGDGKWSISSTHRTAPAATKRLIVLQKNSHGLTFTNR